MNGIELMKLMKWNSLAASLSLMNGTGHQRAEARRQAHQPLQQSKRKWNLLCGGWLNGLVCFLFFSSHSMGQPARLLSLIKEKKAIPSNSSFLSFDLLKKWRIVELIELFLSLAAFFFVEFVGYGRWPSSAGRTAHQSTSIDWFAASFASCLFMKRRKD